jgi:hypothetical protein
VGWRTRNNSTRSFSCYWCNLPPGKCTSQAN